jgi:Flp pilus assembly pilin Flp
MEAQYVRIKYFLLDECGANAVEYAILIASIAVAISSSVGLFGSYVKEMFVNGNKIF